MKKLWVLVVLAALLVPGVLLAGCGNKVPAGAIAAVGSGVVTQQQYNDIVKQAKALYGTSYPKEGSAQYNQLKAQIINYLVENEVVKQKAAAMKISVSDAELAAQIKTIVTKAGGQKKVDALLKQEGTDMNGLNYSEKSQMLLAAVGKKVSAGVKVTDAQITAYYNSPSNKSQFVTAATVTVKHVLVKTKALALKVQALLTAKNTDANWTKVAKQYSIDTGSKTKGGALGTSPKGTFVAAFEKAAFSIKLNTVSAPVHSQFGWHIIEVTKRTAAITKTLAQAKTQIQQQLLSQGQNTVWTAWLKDAMKKLGITYAAGYNPDTLTAAPSPSSSPAS